MKTKYLIIVSLLLLGCCACSKMNDNIDQYLSQGEITYLARPDSVKLFPGRERFLVHFWMRDPRASEMRIYWAQKKDSVCIAIPSTRDKKDPITVMVDQNDPEGDYTLHFVTYDPFGNHSVSDEHTVNVYGDFFQSTLTTRGVKSKSFSKNVLTINWGSSYSTKEYGVRLYYTATDGSAREITIQKADMGSSTKVSDVDPEKEFAYSTVYLPEPAAIDTFFTAKTVIALP